jgi:hypothetical protein
MEDAEHPLDAQNRAGPECKFLRAVETTALHLTYDTAVAGAVSPPGLRIDFSGGYLMHTSAARTTPILQLKTSQTFTYHQKNLFGIGTEVDSHFHNDVPDPLRFTLGGPLRLSASSIDEYRGTDVYLARAGYLRRIAVLPTGFGQGFTRPSLTKLEMHGRLRPTPHCDRMAWRGLWPPPRLELSRSLALLATLVGERSSSASAGFSRSPVGHISSRQSVASGLVSPYAQRFDAMCGPERAVSTERGAPLGS